MKQPEPVGLHLGIALFCEAGQWVATFLQLDIMAQGPTVGVALERLGRTLEAHAYLDARDGRAPFENVPTAPSQFWYVAYATRHPRLGSVPPKKNGSQS